MTMRIQRFLNVIAVGVLTAAVSLSAEPVPQNTQEPAQTHPSRRMSLGRFLCVLWNRFRGQTDRCCQHSDRNHIEESLDSHSHKPLVPPLRGSPCWRTPLLGRAISRVTQLPRFEIIKLAPVRSLQD